MLHNSKKTLAAILSGTLILSTFGTMMPLTASAEQQPVSGDTSDDVRIEEKPINTGSTKVGHYSYGEVAEELLVPHTGKTSELDGGEPLKLFQDFQKSDLESFDENFITLSCNEELYSNLGFVTSDLKKKAQTYATSPEYQNPMAGYSFIDPNELLMGSVNHEGEHKVLFETFNDISITNAEKMASLDKLERKVNPFRMTEDKNNQTHNGIPIDVDGDGIDELAYYSMYYKSSDPNKGTTCWIDILERQQENNGSYSWKKVHSFSTYMDSHDYVLDIIASESKGYVPLAAGDYDNDGVQELAYYMADKSSNTESKDARVKVVKIKKDKNTNQYSHQDLATLKLQDFTADYGKMGIDWFLPEVALSTTKTRLGSVKNTSSGATQYETYDDLVITVSVPKAYRDKNLYMNSITKIFTFEGGNAKELFRYEYKPFNGNKNRMDYVNTCDADLNGDGFKEIVVVGLKEQNMSTPKDARDVNRNYGEFDYKHNYLNIISYTGDNHFQMIWSDPKEIPSPENLDIDHYTAIEPTALCAGHFLAGSPVLKDQICVQGVVIDCTGTKISGAPIASAPNNSQNGYSTLYYITDTEPYCDEDNFKDAGFSKLFRFDASAFADNELWIDQCVSGQFFTNAPVEQIAILSSDPAWDDDQIYFDITIVTSECDSNGNVTWSTKTYNDYIDYGDEDDEGTTMFLCFLNAEEDTYYYRYVGTYSSFSEPILYSVIQVPPYYKEANEVYSLDYEISTGVSDSAGLSLGVGVSLSTETEASVEFFGQSADFGGGVSVGLNFAYNHTWARSKDVSKTISLLSMNDYAVCYATPYIINVYEVVQSKSPSADKEYLQISEPQNPVFTALTIDQYNEAVSSAASRYDPERDEDELPPDEGTPLIDVDQLPPSCSGDPVAYASGSQEICGKSQIKDTDPECGKDELNILNQANYDKQSSSFSFGTSSDNTLSGSLTASAYVKVGFTVKCPGLAEVKGSMTGTLSGEVGASVGRTNSSGITFSVSYTTPEKSLIDGASFLSQNEYYTNDKNTQINHYIPWDKSRKDNGYNPMYNYTVGNVCYRMDGYKVNREMLEDVGGNVKLDADDKVFALGYYTIDYQRTPEPPEDFTIQSLVKNADGSVDVTLLWNSENRNEKRFTDGYNIYMSDLNKNSSNIYLQNTNGLIPANGGYQTYTVHLAPNNYNDNTTFYIAPAYKDTSRTVVQIMEGALSDKAAIASIESNTNGNLIIKSQPQNYYMTKNTESEEASFAIDIQKNIDLDEDVEIYWQKYDSETGSWKEMDKQFMSEPNGTGTKTGLYHSEWSMDIPGDQKDSYLQTGIRCLAKIGNYSVISDLVTILYGEDEPPQPTPDAYTINTYQELIDFRDLYQSQYNTYRNVTVELGSNILVSDNAVWESSIGSESQPFQGTFKGNDYCIIGLTIDGSKCGSLFGVIGEKGTVQDLSVIDCTISGGQEYAGALASVNQGIIDHCNSGVNASGKSKVILRNDVRINTIDYISMLRGTNCGGIVGLNEGTVIGCRNSSFVMGNTCGGIAAVNRGTINSCANNGPIGENSVSVKVIGGITAQNYGTIYCAYNSGLLNYSSPEAYGNIAALNYSEQINNVFYSNVNSIPAIDPESDAPIGGKSEVVSTQDMMTEMFVEKLNQVTDPAVVWMQAQYDGTSLNQGFPTIKGRNTVQKTLTLSGNIMVSGLMHRDMQILASPLKQDSEEYRLFSSKGSGLSVYSFTETDTSGNYVPAELWCAGGYQISVPTNGKQYVLIAQNDNGDLVTVSPEKSDTQTAVYHVGSFTAFALKEVPAVTPVNPDQPIRTGDGFPIALPAIALTALFILILTGKSTFRKDEES